MKSFPAGFTTQKDRSNGAAPIWILKIRANSIDYYLSDVAVSVPIWSVQTKAWIKEWGSLSEGVTGLIDEFKVADFSAVCLADPNASPNIIDLANSYNLEKEKASLYLWFVDTTAAPQEMFRGYIRDYPISGGDTICSLLLQDESIKWQQTYVGRKLSLTDYPGADPDDVGKVIPIPYGTVTGVPILAIDAGIITTLMADITAAATSISITRATGLSGHQISIDEETLNVTAVTGTTCTVTRGYGGTTAGKHNKGATVTEKKTTPLYYIASDVPVDSILKVYAKIDDKLIDLGNSVTTYTGNTGNQLAAHPGKAIVSISDFIKVKKQIQLASNASGLSVDTGSHSHSGTTNTVVVDLQTCVTIAEPINNPEFAVDGDWTTTAVLTYSYSQMRVTRVLPFSTAGTPTRYRLMYTYKIGVNGTQYTTNSSWTNISAWATLTGLTGGIYGNGGGVVYVYAAWLEVEYDTATVAGPATGVALSGNSVADTIVGSSLYIDMVRAMTPVNIFSNLLTTWAGVSGFSQVGTLPASYSLNFVINEYRRLPDWLHDLAWQCRCWIRHSCGSSKITFREAQPTAVKTLAACRIESGKYIHERAKSAYSEVINSITLLYGRDWQLDRSDKAYTASSTASNTTSITDFGEQERPELFLLDAVTNPTHAADLLSYYLAWYSQRHWLHTVGSDYRDCELDFNDPIILGFAANVSGIIMDTEIQPSGDQVTIKMIQ